MHVAQNLFIIYHNFATRRSAMQRRAVVLLLLIAALPATPRILYEPHTQPTSTTHVHTPRGPTSTDSTH